MNDLIPAEIQKQILAALEYCRSVEKLTVNTDDEYQKAGQLTVKAREWEKNLKAAQNELTKPLNTQLDEIRDQFREPMIALDNLKDILRKALARYDDEQTQKRLDAQREADEVARKERNRLAAEADKKANSSMDNLVKGDEKTALKEARESVALSEIATTIKAPEIKPVPKLNGIKFRETWPVEVIDKKILITHLLTTDQVHLLEIDTGTLTKMSNAAKGKMTMPGLKINYEKKTY